MIIKKTKYDFSKLIFIHFAVQKHMYFNNAICENYGTFYMSDNIEDSSWNYFVPENAYLTLRNFDKIYKNLITNKSKASCICLPNYLIDYKYIKELLQEEKYKYKYESKESWLIYDNKKTLRQAKKDNITIKLLNNSKLMKDYLNVFADAYGGEKTELSPYGGLSKEYINSLDEAYKYDNNLAFILYYNNKPVSVASLCLHGGYGGIYGVGTKQADRGQGFSKYLMIYLINYYNSHYDKYLFLQTETDSLVERFYKHLGFKKLFEMEMYVKENFNEQQQ